MRQLPSLRKPEPEAPDPAEDELAPPPPEPRPPQFSIKLILMLMLVASVAAAVWGGMRRGVDREFYVIAATAAPLIVLIVVGVFHQWLRSRRR